MESFEPPAGHTPDGGVLVGSDGARRRLVVFEDPQCPYCREFEDRAGDLVVIVPWWLGVTFQRYYHGKAEYVTVPDALLANTEELKPYLDMSFEYVKGLKPKASKKKGG